MVALTESFELSPLKFINGTPFQHEVMASRLTPLFHLATERQSGGLREPHRPTIPLPDSRPSLAADSLDGLVDESDQLLSLVNLSLLGVAGHRVRSGRLHPTRDWVHTVYGGGGGTSQCQ